MIDCIETTYSKNEHGYGRCNATRHGKKIWLAHVLAWVDANGALPPEDAPCIRHSCDNPPCVNPEHLNPGTHAQNMAEMKERGRAVNLPAAEKASQTHCSHNHEFTPENTIIKANGSRRCRECKNSARRKSG